MARPEAVTQAEHLLKRAYLAMRSRSDALLAQNGVTLPQAEVLAQLWKGEAGCLRDLGANLGTQPATLKGVLDGLEKRGLVVRSSDPSDGRVKRLEVTGAGRELQERVTTVRETVQGHAFDGFTDEEIATFNAWLLRIARNLDQGQIATPLWEPTPT
jgi:DNA-binding MarR family transcriptional regulator